MLSRVMMEALLGRCCYNTTKVVLIDKYEIIEIVRSTCCAHDPAALALPGLLDMLGAALRGGTLGAHYH